MNPETVAECRRTHQRIDTLEVTMTAHIKNHDLLERNLAENTRLTQNISDNTAELVSLVRGVKGFRGFVLWLAPLLAGIGVVTAFVVAVIVWVRGHP